jgi:hypothetical protein
VVANLAAIAALAGRRGLLNIALLVWAADVVARGAMLAIARRAASAAR